MGRISSLCTKASVFLCTKVSVLSFHVLDGIVVTVVMQVTPSNTPAETLLILIECIPNRPTCIKIIQVHVLAPWYSIQTTTTCWCHLVATILSSPLVGGTYLTNFLPFCGTFPPSCCEDV